MYIDAEGYSAKDAENKNNNNNKKKSQKMLIDAEGYSVMDSENKNNDDNLEAITSEQDANENVEDCFMVKYNSLLDTINENFKNQRELMKQLLISYKKETKNNKKNKKNIVKRNNTGFTKSSVIPEQLSRILNLPKETQMSRTQVTKLFFQLLKSKGLHYKKDKRVFRADEQIRDLFGLPESVNKSINCKDKEGFNIFNLQTYIKRCYMEKRKNVVDPVETPNNKKNLNQNHLANEKANTNIQIRISKNNGSRINKNIAVATN